MKVFSLLLLVLQLVVAAAVVLPQRMLHLLPEMEMCMPSSKEVLHIPKHSQTD